MYFHCEKYNNQCKDLKRDVEEILARNETVQLVINLKVLTRNIEEASRSTNGELKRAIGTFFNQINRTTYKKSKVNSNFRLG